MRKIIKEDWEEIVLPKELEDGDLYLEYDDLDLCMGDWGMLNRWTYHKFFEWEDVVDYIVKYVRHDATDANVTQEDVDEVDVDDFKYYLSEKYREEAEEDAESECGPEDCTPWRDYGPERYDEGLLKEGLRDLILPRKMVKNGFDLEYDDLNLHINGYGTLNKWTYWVPFDYDDLYEYLRMFGRPGLAKDNITQEDFEDLDMEDYIDFLTKKYRKIAESDAKRNYRYVTDDYFKEGLLKEDWEPEKIKLSKVLNYWFQLEYTDEDFGEIEFTEDCEFCSGTDTFGDPVFRDGKQTGVLTLWFYTVYPTKEDLIDYLSQLLGKRVTQEDIDNEIVDSIDEEDFFNYLKDAYLDDAIEDIEKNATFKDCTYVYDESLKSNNSNRINEARSRAKTRKKKVLSTK